MTEGLLTMTEGVSRLAAEMLGLVRALPDTSDLEIRQRLDEIRGIEQKVDAAFEESATEIMDLEVFPVNPDYFLETARQLDKMSDLMERTSLLLEVKHGLNDEELELLESAASQVQEIAANISACISNLGRDHVQVEELCGIIVQREEAVDQISDHYNRISSKKGYAIEKWVWLKEILGNLDTIADISRDLTITLRVISNKLEKQSRLDVKRGVMR